MSILAKDLREMVIRPVLESMGAWSESAENLLLLTAAVESQMGRYLKQSYGGPALGIYQMEPATHDDHWDYMVNRRKLRKKVRVWSTISKPSEMVWNLAYATAMARVHYLRIPYPLPAPNDVKGLARYWKRYYNTSKGAGRVEDAIEAYVRLSR